MLAATGLTPEAMPGLVEGSAPGGSVRAALLAEWGIVASGARCRRRRPTPPPRRSASARWRTAMPSSRSAPPRSSSSPTTRYRPQPGTLLHAFAHALPGRWFRMAAMLNGAACLRWVAGIVGAPDIAALLERTEAAYRGPSRVLFLPYLSGERTPHNDPDARGVFVGLDPDARRARPRPGGARGRRLLAGGSARSAGGDGDAAPSRRRRRGRRAKPVLDAAPGARARDCRSCAMPAARRGRPSAPRASPAWRSTSGPAGDVCVKPAVLDVLEPDPALHAAYAERFEAYRRLYRHLRPALLRACKRIEASAAALIDFAWCIV